MSAKLLRSSLGLVVLTVALALLPTSAWPQVTEHVLHSFSPDIGYPVSPLVLDPAGNLYGTIRAGGRGKDHYGGVVYRIAKSHNRWTENLLYSFPTLDGEPSPGGVILDQAGNLYGTDEGGGHSAGVVYSLTKSSTLPWTFHNVHIFIGAPSDGAAADNPLVFDQAGNLYGATVYGGNNACVYGCGVAYKLSPNSDGTWTETIIHWFSGGIDGANPSTRLTLDAAGNIYGCTKNGGALGYGTIFKLAPNSDGTYTPSTVHVFASAIEGEGVSDLISDGAGNLFGTTAGGTYNAGLVFELSPGPDGGWRDTVLYNFTGGADGSGLSGVVLDQAGNLYGAAIIGGNTTGSGTIWKLTPSTTGWALSVLYSFSGPDGNGPAAPVVLGQAGNVYGTTDVGGAHGAGVVFELTP
jgi:uncharacterized repeat protein (TIGR03803 family)